MRHVLSAVFVLSFLALPVQAQTAEIQEQIMASLELKRLEGTWQLVGYEFDGKKADPDKLKSTQLIADGKGLLRVTRDGELFLEGKTKLNPTTSPPSFESEYTKGEKKGQKAHGIYELKGDRYRSCFGPADKERPKEFATAEGSGRTLVIYERVTKK